eukprot:2499255-Pleurochrysis_carterae.AAC.1
MEELWESKETWTLRMDWMRKVLANCMSTHWGVKLGLYLALNEHMPSRQILRIAQVSYTLPTTRVRLRPRLPRAFAFAT